jgi:2-polyprenyl-6-methoxyphenol hydroxylase-like FAD-dependent oxidoreductase
VGQLKAVVAGGGIAGLASAVALLQAGWQVLVLERAPAFGEVGAGVALTVNGMTALDALGVGDAVRAAGHRVRSAGFQDCRGRWLLRIPDRSPEREPTIWLWAVHRQRLHAALLDAASDAELLTGATVDAVEPGMPGGQRARVTYRDGAGAHGVDVDLVIAADGLRSVVRTALFPDAQPRYGGATSWRAVIVDADVIDDRYVAAWGPGTEFGALRIKGTQVYWYGYFLHSEGASFEDELGTARAMFAGWQPWVTRLLAATTPGDLLRHDVYHLGERPASYVQGRVALAGDAAHAMLPTSGQGVSSALEDALCIGRLVAEPVLDGGDLAAALSTYDRARRPRCQRLARQALTIARFGAHLPDGGRQHLRNGLLRIIPGTVAVSAGRSILDWTPPPQRHEPG